MSEGSSEGLPWHSPLLSRKPYWILATWTQRLTVLLLTQKLSLYLITYGTVIIQWFPALTQPPQPFSHGGQTEFSQWGSEDSKGSVTVPSVILICAPSTAWKLNLKSNDICHCLRVFVQLWITMALTNSEVWFIWHKRLQFLGTRICRILG